MQSSKTAGSLIRRSGHSERAFITISLLIFAGSTTATIVWCKAMSEIGAMPMGDWTMSMAWMRMPGQSWTITAITFIGMWVVMMLAMMLPSFVFMLKRYRQAVVLTSATRMGRLTILVGISYFLSWTVFGVITFPLGVALTQIEMQYAAVARIVPIAVAVVVVFAGALQFTAWKSRHLMCCRTVPGPDCTLPADAHTAWRHGMSLGVHCIQSCVGLIAILLVIGVMDLRAMAIVAAAITIERLAPAGDRVAGAIGIVVIAAGMLLVVRAVGLAS